MSAPSSSFSLAALTPEQAIRLVIATMLVAANLVRSCPPEVDHCYALADQLIAKAIQP
jgi:hypothetical protein